MISYVDVQPCYHGAECSAWDCFSPSLPILNARPALFVSGPVVRPTDRTQGHLDRIKRIHGYLSKMRHATFKIRTDAPDYSDISVKLCDWECTCYADAKEEIPLDAPEPKGKPVTMTSYFDANLYHNLISGKSVTGCLHLLNKTPIDWYSKLQSTVETATFGSEYVAARTCAEQIIDLRLSLRY